MTTRRRLTTLAWLLGAIGLGFVLAAGAFFAAGGYRVPVLYGNEIGIALGFTCVGAVVAARVTGNPLGWLMLCVGAQHAAGVLAMEYVSWLGHAAVNAPPALVTYAEVSWMPGFVFFLMMPLLFPTGHPPGRGWRVLGWTGIVGGALTMTASVTGSRRWTDYHVANAAYFPRVASVAVVGAPILAATVIGSFASFVVRYRRSTGIVRQQMRWYLWACLLAFVVIVPELAVNRHNALTVTAQALSVLGIPVAIGVAILRYRLFDIDRLISRTLSYVLVTGLLVATYVGGVALLTDLGPFSSSVGVAATTLLVAAAFNPLRRRVQTVVDHRFNRGRYDASRTIDAFAVRLRDEVDPEVVAADLLGVAATTVEPALVSLWVAG